MSNVLEYYNDAAGDYRWRVKNRENGEILSASTEGFTDLRNAMDNYQMSLEPASQTIYPEGSRRGPDQSISLEGQDFSDREEEDANGTEGGTDGPAGSGESAEGEDEGSVNADSVGAGYPEEQWDDRNLDSAGSLPPTADGPESAKGSRRQGRGTRH